MIGDHLGDVLSGLIDGELDPAQAAAAQAHVAGCRSCAAELDDVTTARALVRGLPALEPPFGFYERILRDDRRAGRLGPTPAASGWGSTPRRVAAAAFGSAAAAVVLLGLAPPRDTPVKPPVNSLVEAHATGASFGSDPLSRLAPLGVPVTFSR